MSPATAWLNRALAGAAAALALLTVAPAQAAPQVLALVATGAPVPLHCADDNCLVELPSLCLQPERRAPQAGRAYRPWQAADIRVVGAGADGAPQSLPLPAAASLTAARTHVAVRLSLPRDWVERHFGAGAGVEVHHTAALVPVPAADDLKPLQPAEVAQAATGQARLAAGVVSADGPRRIAVRLTTQLINALPAAADAETQVRAWRRAVADLPAADRRAETLTLARFQFDYCRYNAANGLSADLRDCLAAQQDGALEVLHGQYLDALAAGS